MMMEQAQEPVLIQDALSFLSYSTSIFPQNFVKKNKENDLHGTFQGDLRSQTYPCGLKDTASRTPTSLCNFTFFFFFVNHSHCTERLIYACYRVLCIFYTKNYFINAFLQVFSVVAFIWKYVI